MGDLVVIVGALLSIVLLLVVVDRSRVIAVCRVERGKLRVTRGRLSPRVVAELRDVAERMKMTGATIIVRKEGGMPTLRLQGVEDAATQQQLRNVIGRFKLAQLR